MFIYFLLIFCSNIAKKFLKSLFRHNKAQMATCLTIFTVGKMVFTKKSTCLIRGNLGGWNTSHLTLFLNYFLIVDMIFSGSFMIINERICIADRKSTRLNSSHVAISYAVFCLKKKMNREQN